MYCSLYIILLDTSPDEQHCIICVIRVFLLSRKATLEICLTFVGIMMTVDDTGFWMMMHDERGKASTK
jgi:hypothetical protein